MIGGWESKYLHNNMTNPQWADIVYRNFTGGWKDAWSFNSSGF